jgi:phosphate transport system substrate-binding protein
VQAGFTQVNKLKLADSKVSFDASIIKNVKNCHNPTFVAGKPSENYLAKIAPFPAECDRPGHGPCGAGVSSYNDNPDDDGKVPANPDGKGGTGGDSSGTGGDSSGTGWTTGGEAPGAAPGATDPGIADDLGLGGGTTSGGGDTASVVATTLSSDGSAGPPGVLTALVVGLFIGTLVVPTVVSQTVSRRRGRR